MGRTRTWRCIMCDIPLDLQRKFEQRWAAGFARPVALEEAGTWRARSTACRAQQSHRKIPPGSGRLEIFIAGLKSRVSQNLSCAPSWRWRRSQRGASNRNWSDSFRQSIRFLARRSGPGASIWLWNGGGSYWRHRVL